MFFVSEASEKRTRHKLRTVSYSVGKKKISTILVSIDRYLASLNDEVAATHVYKMTQSAQAPQPNGVLFHPSFPDLWQVAAAAPALGIQAQRQPPLHADRPTRSTATDGGPLLQPGQVIKGRAHGAAWIQTEEGCLPRWTSDPEGAVVQQFLVQPYWPTYLVVGHAQAGTRGVAPYVLEDTEGTKKSPAAAGLLRLPTNCRASTTPHRPSSIRN